MGNLILAIVMRFCYLTLKSIYSIVRHKRIAVMPVLKWLPLTFEQQI